MKIIIINHSDIEVDFVTRNALVRLHKVRFLEQVLV